MASPVTNGYTWTNEQITPANLNAMFTSATFNSNAVDATTTVLSGGAVIVKDAGISTAKIADLAVNTAKLAANSVTTAKLDTALDLSGITITLAAGQIAGAAIADDGITYDQVLPATQAEQEAESAAGVVTPDVLKYHPAAAKCYGVVTFDTSTATVSGDYNVGSVSDTTTNTRRVTFTNAMASSAYTVTATENWNSGESPYISAKTSTYFDISHNNSESSGQSFNFTVFGDLA
jgi:hypothetical protein